MVQALPIVQRWYLARSRTGSTRNGLRKVSLSWYDALCYGRISKTKNGTAFPVQIRPETLKQWLCGRRVEVVIVWLELVITCIVRMVLFAFIPVGGCLFKTGSLHGRGWSPDEDGEDLVFENDILDLSVLWGNFGCVGARLTRCWGRVIQLVPSRPFLVCRILTNQVFPHAKTKCALGQWKQQ